MSCPLYIEFLLINFINVSFQEIYNIVIFVIIYALNLAAESCVRMDIYAFYCNCGKDCEPTPSLSFPTIFIVQIRDFKLFLQP